MFLTRFTFLAVALAALPSRVTAETSDTNGFEQLWDLATLYKNDRNPILEEFKLRGRYQGQYHKTDNDKDTEDDWEDRRSRFGFDAKMFEKKIELRFDFQSNDGFRDIYDGLVDAYVRWKPMESLSITAGRTKPLIGYYDFLQSTNNQPTFERSQIFNQLNVDRVTSLTAEGKIQQYTWQAGLYSNSVDGGEDRNDFDNAFGRFNGGYSFSLGAGYDFSKLLDLKKADFRVDWLHSERDADSNQLSRYDDIVSSTFWLQDGVWSFVAEAFAAGGGDGANEDVLGGYLQGTYDLLPKKLQLVGRYSASIGNGDTSLRPQPRYESEGFDPDITGGAGDNYNAVYLGGQYFINGDKLKILAGIEYANLDGGPSANDFNGFTYLTGLRFSF